MAAMTNTGARTAATSAITAADAGRFVWLRGRRGARSLPQWFVQVSRAQFRIVDARSVSEVLGRGSAARRFVRVLRVARVFERPRQRYAARALSRLFRR